ncbi:MAG: hypothetical protein PHX68_00210 [Alphaproteobacteria bacterium]|nr:hypothetical protein [Alphaproteobacteria bacterium]
MQKIVLMLVMAALLGCAPKKPDLAPTQIVGGRDITIPPEFDKTPAPQE